ncbi:MAG TPA: hypothetical protein VKQ06_02075 [Gammaproteobacteria bacterium]|nr:hypothetical protein [Gammaproteobacteria bacterium]
MPQRIILLCLSTLACLAGCGEERTRPPSTTVAVVNAAPGFANLSLRRGTTNQAQLGQVQFPGIFSARVDSDTYNFSVDTQDSISGLEIFLADFTAEVDAQRQHLFLLAEQNQMVVPLITSREPIDAAASTWDATIFNAAENAGNVDVYLTPPETDLGTAMPAGTLDFGESVLLEALQPGPFVITVTQSGDTASVLFTSTTTGFVAGNWATIAIVPDVNGFADVLSAIVVSATSSNLTDVNAPARTRLLNGAADGLARDFYVGDDFSAPFAPGVEVAAPSEFLALADGTDKISVTPAGNASVIEAERSGSIAPGSLYEAIVAGPAGALEFSIGAENLRRNNLHARIMLMSAVNYYETLDAWLFPEGTDISQRPPNWTLTSPIVTERVLFPTDNYELTVQDPVTDTVVLGPLSLTLEPRGIYSIALVDSGDGTTVNALLLDDFE